jgi:hypothetical protein
VRRHAHLDDVGAEGAGQCEVAPQCEVAWRRQVCYVGR